MNYRLPTKIWFINMQTTFLENWNRKFASSCRRVLVGVSGGLDSMTLCHLLYESRIPFAIAHVNFQLRGEDSLQDELWVQERAASYRTEFFVVHFDTALIAAQQKKGIQETARDLRYTWFEQLRQQHGFDRIATAHHADDSIETLLMNFFKGTGLAGLHGIPERQNKIIRPLLPWSRKEIADYARARGIIFREDASNASEKYLRNNVRHVIIPTIEKYFPGASVHLSENIRRFSQSEMIYRLEVQRQLKKLVELRGRDLYLPVKKWMKLPFAETLFYELLREYNFSASQASEAVTLMQASSGKHIASATHRMIRDRDFLIVTTASVQQTDFIRIESAPFEIRTEHFTISGAFKDFDGSTDSKASVALLDADAVSWPLTLRPWRTGDYFYPLGMARKKKKLSRFLIDQKVPLHEKERIWVLESQRRMAWVIGHRIDERFKLLEKTRKVLQVEVRMHELVEKSRTMIGRE